MWSLLYGIIPPSWTTKPLGLIKIWPLFLQSCIILIGSNINCTNAISLSTSHSDGRNQFGFWFSQFTSTKIFFKSFYILVKYLFFITSKKEKWRNAFAFTRMHWSQDDVHFCLCQIMWYLFPSLDTIPNCCI